MQEPIKLFTDGGARGNPGPAAYAYVICKMDDSVVEKSGEHLGRATNNQAEYKGLIAGLERADSLQLKNLHVFMDSELIIRQMEGAYKVKNPDLRPLYEKAKELASRVDQITFTHVARALNSAADAEVNRILDAASN